MIYVFTFIGEFGYELLNWQGTIRKWSKNKKPGDKIVVCSRKGLDVMYESADYYYDISNLDSLKNVVADCYTSYVFTHGTGPHLPRREWQATRTGEHITAIKNEVGNLVIEELGLTTDHRVKWIWSCDYEIMNECLFGLECPGGSGGIYNNDNNRLNLNNNEYIKLPYVSDLREKIESELGFSLD